MNTTLILGNKILTKNDVELRTLKHVSFLNYELSLPHVVIFGSVRSLRNAVISLFVLKSHELTTEPKRLRLV